MKKAYDFKRDQRSRFAEKCPALEGKGVQERHPRIVNVSFDVSQEVAAALRALRDTGFYGNGVDCASVAEELLRQALLDPKVLPHWQTASREEVGERFACRACGRAHRAWAPRCRSCGSLEGLAVNRGAPRRVRGNRAGRRRS